MDDVFDETTLTPCWIRSGGGVSHPSVGGWVDPDGWMDGWTGQARQINGSKKYQCVLCINANRWTMIRIILVRRALMIPTLLWPPTSPHRPSDQAHPSKHACMDPDGGAFPPAHDSKKYQRVLCIDSHRRTIIIPHPYRISFWALSRHSNAQKAVSEQILRCERSKRRLQYLDSTFDCQRKKRVPSAKSA